MKTCFFKRVGYRKKIKKKNFCFILTESKNVRNIATERHSIEFFPGFRTCYMNIMAGSFLNVTIKNRILSSKTINELIQGYRQNEIRDYLIGISFKPIIQI